MISETLLNIKSIFFHNKTVKQTVFKNTFWLGVGLGVSKLLKMVLIIYVARILGATEYGKFTFALAFVSVFIIFSDLGLSAIITREFSREREKDKEFYSILSLKMILVLGTLILISIASFFITPDPGIRKIILILAFFSMVEGFATTIYVFFQAIQRMEYQAFATILESILVTGLGLFVILHYPSVENISYTYLLTSLITLFFVLILFHFKVFPLRISFDKSVWKKFLLMAFPLVLSGVFNSIYNYTDSVMMGYWKLMAETGWYNAAYKLVAIAGIPLGLIFASFYPVLSRFFKESKEQLKRAWSYQMDIVILSTIPLVVGGIVLAPKIIDFAYGSNFTPAILAFKILIVMTGITFFSQSFQYLLLAANQEKIFFWVTASAAVLNIVLNFLLIPRFSLYGAAVATTITYLLIFFLFLKLTTKFVGMHPFSFKSFTSFIGAAISSILMYFVISQPKIYNLNIFLSVIIGAAIYISSILTFKRLTKNPKLNFIKHD